MEGSTQTGTPHWMALSFQVAEYKVRVYESSALALVKNRARGCPIARVVGSIMLLLFATAGCQYPDPLAHSLPHVPPGFPSDPTLLLEPSIDATSFTQLGTAQVSVRTMSASGGSITSTPGPSGSQAVRMPPFTTAPQYPRAVIRVQSIDHADDLSPDTAKVVWGADFRIDSRSEGHADRDNGDNLLQRGLAGQPAEYKAELDLHRPGCTATGTRGTVVVRTLATVRPETWYRMRCIRQADTLTVKVVSLATPTDEYVRQKTGPIGSIHMSPWIPVAIGGKLGPHGHIMLSSTDQFNGAIANPLIDIR